MTEKEWKELISEDKPQGRFEREERWPEPQGHDNPQHYFTEDR
jgi:hypothetical protein